MLEGPTPPNTIVIVLGSDLFPSLHANLSNPAFLNSANEFVSYAASDSGLGVRGGALLNLFGSELTIVDQDEEITRFITNASTAKNVLFYYVGHGGFLADRDYFLALKCTKSQKEHLTGLRIRALAETLRGVAPSRNVILILDCCFSGEAVKEFQPIGLSEVIEKSTFDALPSSSPTSGTALLVAASKDEPALAPVGNSLTMFAECFVEVLKSGIQNEGPLLSLRDVGGKTAELVRARYGMKGVRPQVHSPSQFGADIASILLFPNAAARSNAINSRIEELPLEFDLARKLLRAADEAQKKVLRELVFAYELYETIGNCTDFKPILARAKKIFADPLLVSRDAIAEALRKSQEEFDKFADAGAGNDDWRNKYVAVEEAVRALLEPLPQKAECQERIFSLPPEVYRPFLFLEYYSDDHLHGRSTILELIAKAGGPAQFVQIVEDILWGRSYPDWEFTKAVEISRRAKKNEFDAWYRNIRGQSYRDEVTAYERKEAERLRANENAREAELGEFSPSESPMSLSDTEAAELFETLSHILKEIRAIDASFDSRANEVEPLAEKVKHLLRGPFPEAAYRIHRAQKNHTGIDAILRALDSAVQSVAGEIEGIAFRKTSNHVVTEERPANRDSSPRVDVAAQEHVVIMVQGIRYSALWLTAVRRPLEQQGFIGETITYGHLTVLQLLLPFRYFRRKAISSVAHQIRMIRRNNVGADLSIIAHGFGTYLVAQLLRENFDIELHRVIFCGSFARYDFPFEQLQARFTQPIINDVGTRDIWPALVESITYGYGSAGSFGFRRPMIWDRWHNGSGHSSFFNSDFTQRFWIPFLRNGSIVPGEAVPEEPPVWLRLLSVIKLRNLPYLAAGLYLLSFQSDLIPTILRSLFQK